ncbi:MAG TPA: hypothetical protein VJ043_00460 [Candidatus Paceibacterota bacterium]|nr:hypothetical protein [Candidatus Paceibacterota bacterium]
MRSDSIGQHSEARHEAPERHGAFNKALLFIVLEALMSISAAMAQEVRPATETIQPKLFTFRDKDIHEGIRELMLTQEERERAGRIVESLKRLIEEINRPGLNTSLEKLVKEFFPDMLGTLGNADALPPRDVHAEVEGDAASWIKLNAHTPIAFGIRKFFENEDRHRDIFKIMENEGEVRNFFVHEYFHFSGVLMYGGDEYSERVQDYGLLEEGMADYFAMLAAHEEGRTAPRSFSESFFPLWVSRVMGAHAIDAAFHRRFEELQKLFCAAFPSGDGSSYHAQDGEGLFHSVFKFTRDQMASHDPETNYSEKYHCAGGIWRLLELARKKDAALADSLVKEYNKLNPVEMFRYQVRDDQPWLVHKEYKHLGSTDDGRKMYVPSVFVVNPQGYVRHCRDIVSLERERLPAEMLAYARDWMTGKRYGKE